ncbi:MAG: phage tail terminator-like protein [Halobacteriota archaeon]
MSQKAIRSIITKALVAWATPKNIPISREGQAFTKPTNNGTFIELHIIPANTIVASLDGTRKSFRGDVTCNIWVKDNTGTSEAEELAEEIAVLFPVVPKIYLPVSVEDTPSIKRPIPDESGYRITPVCFSYRAEY